MMIIDHDHVWAAVAAREDVDGRGKTVVYIPNRDVADDDRIEIEMGPAEARRLARALNLAAKRLA